MSKRARLAIAAILFLMYGAIVLHSGWFAGSARQAEEKLRDAVQAQLLAARYKNVTVEMDGQVAIISGTAGSESERREIIRAVRSARWSGGLILGGVTAIRAEGLSVLPPVLEPDTPFVWTAEKTEDGTVLLAGMIPDEVARDKLTAHARSTFPVGVIDRMSVASGVPAGDWTLAASKSLDALGRLQTGRVTGSGAVFNVTGKAASQEIANLTEENLYVMPEGYRAEPNISAPEPPGIQSPYIWEAIMEKPGKSVILNGYVPDRDIARDILTHAKSVLSTRVMDRMVIAPGVPEGVADGVWAEAIKTSLTVLADLEGGRVFVSDLDFAVSGKALDAAAADNARMIIDDLGLNFPRQDFQSRIDIEVLSSPAVETADECQALFDDAMQEATINFETAKAVIRADSHPLLDSLAVVSKRCNDFKIIVSGHTDNVGAATLNQRLSEARAQSVVGYLVATAGIDEAQLSARGFGEDNPIADNATPEGRAQNRRIEFTIEQ